MNPRLSPQDPTNFEDYLSLNHACQIESEFHSILRSPQLSFQNGQSVISQNEEQRDLQELMKSQDRNHDNQHFFYDSIIKGEQGNQVSLFLNFQDKQIQGMQQMQQNIFPDIKSEMFNPSCSAVNKLKQEQVPQHGHQTIFLKRKFNRQNKNIPRFLVRLAIKFLKQYKEEYSLNSYQKVVKECELLQQWHLKKKSHVYLINHLRQLFSDDKKFDKDTAKINRKVFKKILHDKALKEMMHPKSQVRQNKLSYMISSKVYSLRCMSTELVARNQTR